VDYCSNLFSLLSCLYVVSMFAHIYTSLSKFVHIFCYGLNVCKVTTFCNWSVQITRGHYRIVETYINMNMALHVYEYGRGGKCVYMFRCTYAGIRQRKMQMEKKDRHIPPFPLRTHNYCVCVLLCFVDPILGNRYRPGVIP